MSLPSAQTVAVVGAGPAGLMAALVAAGAGHRVVLFDGRRLGGQLNLARQGAGQGRIRRAGRWFAAMVARSGIEVRLGDGGRDDLRGFDEVVVATGVAPRDPGIAGQDRALSYARC